MDARDVKEEPKQVTDGRYLEEIYTLQKVLVDHYVMIEGLPPYPIDVNTKKSQTILKDFTGRVIEELAEGFESHVLIANATNLHRLWSDEDGTSQEYTQMINHLQNLNEEQADAMHFMTELLIYCNVQPDDIQAWLIKHAKENGYEPSLGNDVIDNAMRLGNLFWASEIEECRQFHQVDLTQHVSPTQLRYLPGARKYSDNVIDLSARLLWAVTYHINISRNCLKNKPWKQSGVMTDETLYQSKVVEAFMYMMTYFSSIGISSSQVYYMYFKKNRVNQFRITSNY